MQLAFSFDTWVPLAPQHDFPPAKDELAANTPAANKAKVVLIMHLRQHELTNVQTAPLSSRVAETTRDLAYVNGRYKIACVIRTACVRSLACARDDAAHCKGHD